MPIAFADTSKLILPSYQWIRKEDIKAHVDDDTCDHDVRNTKMMMVVTDDYENGRKMDVAGILILA
jgi:hypothetical protein